jgi:hypothetical protein
MTIESSKTLVTFEAPVRPKDRLMSHSTSPNGLV